MELCDFFYFVKFVFRAVARVGVSETLDVGCFHSILVLGGTGSILCVIQHSTGVKRYVYLLYVPIYSFIHRKKLSFKRNLHSNLKN